MGDDKTLHDHSQIVNFGGSRVKLFRERENGSYSEGRGEVGHESGEAVERD